jgi:nucleotide-binding universal stress UspA family protein
VKRVVVGVDGSKISRTALAWAGRLAGPCGADLVVATVLGSAPAQADANALAEGTERVAGIEEWCAELQDDVRARLVVGEGRPAEELLRVAEDEDADLLVVGHRGRGHARRLGSVALHVAHHAPRPFAVVPTALATAPLKFVVGLDGSRASALAAEWLTPIARALGAPVVAAFVPWPMPEVFATRTKGPWEEAQRVLDEDWCRPLRERLPTVTTTLVDERDPARGLLHVTDGDPDVTLVIGTRRLGGLRPLRIGGVTLGTLHHADVPVIVVPAMA